MYATIIYYQEDKFHLLQDFSLFWGGGGWEEGGGGMFRVMNYSYGILNLPFFFGLNLYNWLYEGIQPVTI